jgi:hypothetical protein
MRFPFQRLIPVLLIACSARIVTADEEISVFRRPELAESSHEMQLRAILTSQAGHLEDAVKLSEEAEKVAPFWSVSQYNLACLYSLNGQTEECIKRLTLAIDLGFRNAKLMGQDSDLNNVRETPEYKALFEKAKVPFDKPKPKPSPFENGIAWVGPENTVWDEPSLLRTAFEWKRPARLPAVISGHGDIGKRLQKWFAEGTAAGNFGDLYDNCDRDHSNMKYAQFPQLHRIEYRPAIVDEVAFGLQHRFVHGGVVLGNSSTSLVNSPYWRSNPRAAYTKAAVMSHLVRQYYENHLYVYPEHTDHDPGHNGEGGGGYGDVYPANSPFFLISQGSSYTDVPFLDAIACTLAAFRPPVKQRIVENGLMAPTLQQIFRSNYKLVKTPEDYLTGIAHPSVFEGSKIDASKMVDAAHAMSTNSIPPLIKIKVEQQDRAVVGRDYFEVSDREILFDTQSSIARIGRSTQFRRQMVVSARDSIDLEKRPLKFKWVILRGDESRISIKPTDEDGSVAEITVAWHPRRKIHPDSDMESNRVDIGVFAHNGVSWSAPGFVSWYFLDNEEREYDEQGRILSVAYHGGTDTGNYADPYIQTPKTWKDTYRYTPDGKMIGWTRTRGKGPDEKGEEFTADGGVIIEKDELGRAAAIRAPVYLALAQEGKPLPRLIQHRSDNVYRYTYDGPEDLIGKITSHEKSAPAN